MGKLFTVLVPIFTLHLNAIAQIAFTSAPVLSSPQLQLLSDLKKDKNDSARFDILKFVSNYLYKIGEFKSSLDSADLFQIIQEKARCRICPFWCEYAARPKIWRAYDPDNAFDLQHLYKNTIHYYGNKAI